MFLDMLPLASSWVLGLLAHFGQKYHLDSAIRCCGRYERTPVSFTFGLMYWLCYAALCPLVYVRQPGCFWSSSPFPPSFFPLWPVFLNHLFSLYVQNVSSSTLLCSFVILAQTLSLPESIHSFSCHSRILAKISWRVDRHMVCLCRSPNSAIANAFDFRSLVFIPIVSPTLFHMLVKLYTVQFVIPILLLIFFVQLHFVSATEPI